MASTTKSKHGGARPGAGRKPLENPLTKSIVVRCHEEQHAHFTAHMGAEWLRKTIDRHMRRVRK